MNKNAIKQVDLRVSAYYYHEFVYIFDTSVKCKVISILTLDPIFQKEFILAQNKNMLFNLYRVVNRIKYGVYLINWI